MLRRDHDHRPRVDAAVDHHQEIPARAQAGVVRVQLRRGQHPDRGRRAVIFPQRRRRGDADPKGAAAAGPAPFRQANERETATATATSNDTHGGPHAPRPRSRSPRLRRSRAGARAHEHRSIPTGRASGSGRTGPGTQWDPTKPAGLAQQAPLTPEYQAKYEASIADQAAGGQGTTRRNLPPARHAAHDDRLRPMEIVVMPDDHLHHASSTSHAAPHLHRRPHIPDRSRADLHAATRSASGSTPTATASYDTLEVETRGMKGPRTFDQAASRCTRTTRPSSRSASISTRPTRTSSMTRSPPSITR